MKYDEEEWGYLADTPEEFETAIKNAVSEKEREFFEKFRYKILNETAASNDVLMHNKDNEDGLYILRVGTDDVMIGHRDSDDKETVSPSEFGGIFLALDEDLHDYIGRHVSLLEWLRKRDYAGIKYNANNDYL